MLPVPSTPIHAASPPWRRGGRPWGSHHSSPTLVALVMTQAMLGFTSEARWLRHARAYLRHLFPSNHFGRDFERELGEYGLQLVRPTRRGERRRPGGILFEPWRQIIESVNETFTGRLDFEQHRGRTPRGVIACVMQRILALTAALWHNDRTGQPVLRSLTAHDH